jgi:hypothetical protein
MWAFCGPWPGPAPACPAPGPAPAACPPPGPVPACPAPGPDPACPAPGPDPGCAGAAWAAGLAAPFGGGPLGSARADSANTVTSDTRGSTILARLDVFIFTLPPLPGRCSLKPVESTDAINLRAPIRVTGRCCTLPYRVRDNLTRFTPIVLLRICNSRSGHEISGPIGRQFWDAANAKANGKADGKANAKRTPPRWQTFDTR